MKNNQGFTLVEMVIAIVVGLVIIAAIYAAVNMGQRSTVNVERRVAAHQDARAALELMALEIQMASYNPNSAPNMWVAPGNCTPGSGTQSNRGIQAATNSSITIEMDIGPGTDGDGVVGNSTNEVITYTYNSGSQYITRSTGCSGFGGNQPFLGDIPGNPRAVRVINTDAVPVFRYYDAQGNPTANIPDIARIDITVWVETADVDQETNARRRMIYSTSVIPRNHAI